MTFRRRTLCLAAATIAAATAAAPAQAAPDWTPAKDLGDPAQESVLSEVGYTDDGLELTAHFEDLSSLGHLVVTSRRAGGDRATDLRLDPLPGNTYFHLDFDVAPTGAAVVTWEEYNAKDFLNARHEFRAAYRRPSGTWEQPVTIAADEKVKLPIFPAVSAAIGDDGSAVAGVERLETGPDAEFQPDGRADVRVHSPGGSWDPAVRLSAEEKGAAELQLGVDERGAATAAWTERTSESATNKPADDLSTVKVRRYSPSNGLWSSAEDLGGGTQTQSSLLKLDVAPDGRALVAYQAAAFGIRSTVATRRSSATAAFAGPASVDTTDKNGPLAAGLSPDGTSYVLIADDSGTTRKVLAARAPAGGTFGSLKPLGLHAGFPTGAIGFRGNDAFLGWSNDAGVPAATVWPAAASDPDASRDLDTRGGSFRQIASDRNGSSVAVWDGTSVRRYAAFDGSAPRTTGASVPSEGGAGTELTMSAGFGDLFSPIAGDPEWDFGDGATATGATTNHAYAQPGDYTVTVRGRDARGNERTQTFPVTISAAQPQQEQQQPAGAPATPSAPAAPAAPSDMIAPTIKLKQPARKLRATRAGWQTLRGTIADAQPSSGIKRVEVTAFRPKDKRKVRTAKVTGANWNLKLPKLTRGNWTFKVRVIDNAGNSSKAVQKKVRLR